MVILHYILNGWFLSYRQFVEKSVYIFKLFHYIESITSLEFIINGGKIVIKSCKKADHCWIAKEGRAEYINRLC